MRIEEVFVEYTFCILVLMEAYVTEHLTGKV